MTSLANKVALITGSTSGIGKAAAIAFAKAGAKVVVSGRRESEGAAVVADITAAGGIATFVRCDVTREAEVKALVERTVATYGRLDAAFNNAGIEERLGPLTDKTDADYDLIMDVNVRGLFYSMKHEIPALLKSGGGAIVNTSSIAGLVGFSAAPIYTGAKFATVGMTKAMALQLAKDNIRVNAVCPAAIETDMVERVFGPGENDTKKAVAAMHPLGRMGTSAEVANMVVWLCSAESSFVTGQALAVDGGWTAQ
jgi:NAD(P)-dependent dehydrogenase (short-subunit alcohol dehydrogenase family)